jgi:hypothetical protein
MGEDEGMSKGVALTGIPSEEELQNSPGYPNLEDFEKGPIAVIECVQEEPLSSESLSPTFLVSTLTSAQVAASVSRDAQDRRFFWFTCIIRTRNPWWAFLLSISLCPRSAAWSTLPTGLER